eukprot:6093559-Amphidinium_carterae.1
MSQGIYAVERAPENDQLLSDAKPPPEGPCVDWAAEQFLADIRPKIEEAQRIALDIAPRRWRVTGDFNPAENLMSYNCDRATKS